MAKLADLAPLEVSAATGFHRDNARRQLPEKLQHLRSPQLLAQNPPARAIGPMDLKHILRQIESDRDNLRHDRSPLWILADPPWHRDAVCGRLHHQCPRVANFSTQLLTCQLLSMTARNARTGKKIDMIRRVLPPHLAGGFATVATRWRFMLPEKEVVRFRYPASI